MSIISIFMPLPDLYKDKHGAGQDFISNHWPVVMTRSIAEQPDLQSSVEDLWNPYWRYLSSRVSAAKQIQAIKNQLPQATIGLAYSILFHFSLTVMLSFLFLLFQALSTYTLRRHLISEGYFEGKTLQELKNVKTLKELKDLGFGPKLLTRVGFNLEQLRREGFTATELKNVRFTATELKNARFTATELKNARFTATELKDARFTATELKNER
jgi:hypothetical protein